MSCKRILFSEKNQQIESQHVAKYFILSFTYKQRCDCPRTIGSRGLGAGECDCWGAMSRFASGATAVGGVWGRPGIGHCSWVRATGRELSHVMPVVGSGFEKHRVGLGGLAGEGGGTPSDHENRSGLRTKYWEDSTHIFVLGSNGRSLFEIVPATCSRTGPMQHSMP